MKKNILKYGLLCLVMTLTACDDFFNVDTDNILDHTDYINEESEMYSGYIGIITKMQAVGDKIIYLTDIRGEMLEPTFNTPVELYSLYNYDTDLTGNSYADPAPYYDVVIACNDYLLKLYDYKEKNPASINKSHYEALVSCALRVKAWTYLNIAKIYGEAYWYDGAMREKPELPEFPEVKKLDEVVVACKDLLDKGFDGINGKHTMSWKEWLDPDTEVAKSNYRYWDYMTPEYFALYAELCLWSGDYQKAANLILNAMNEKFASTVNDATAWMHNDKIGGVYATIWNNTNPAPQETVSAIIYDYQKNQTNSLLKHFGSESPNEYLLAPSKVGMDRFSDSDFNPLGGAGSDRRTSVTFTKDNAGNYVIQKFRPVKGAVRTFAYQDDVHIYTYRGSELYFMLAEAMNNLGRYDEASALINNGLNGSFPSGGVFWDGFTDDWTSNHTTLGTRKYPDKGIRGVHSLGMREFTKNAKDNDLAILDEMMLEFSCEGKIYPAMIRIARRYGDFDIIADRVCPKYANPDEIRAKIKAGGYFINWDLNNKSN
ncbi:RagB/SusD family nutrient uptake outer membrane protein [Bacteroides sp. 224]|uniref:RagB/SusD family nutrient uptake outer membrane protein n=1 Tax=Bacteroides sp. 224 TaxID=2302936 RepID=UPI001EF165CC|nr:RagB/SusD family nutrient uptake outer membrane protein [Bacteroides sp. 224]